RGDLARIGLVELLARVLLEEQAFHRFGAGAGEMHERDRAVAVFQRELHADAELITVLRAVAIRAHPLRRAAREGVEELLRGRLEDEPALFILHQALGQRLRVEVATGGSEVELLLLPRRRAL